jgi:hypothetical protein
MPTSDPARGRLTPEQRDELSDLAAAVLEENSPGDKPVDPAAIARAKGLLLVYGNYGEAFDGLLRHRGGEFTVFCNLTRVEGERTHRARFTLAHELGHYFISNHRNALRSGLAVHHPSFCEFESKLFVEQQADYFASSLLLPRARFLTAARNSGTNGGLRTVLGLAQKFDTSVTATAIRYVSLGVSPCIVIKWGADKYGWKWLSDHAFAAGYRKTIEDKAAVIDGSATASAFAGESLPPEGYFKRASLASVWFPFIKPGTPKDVILQEHAKPLGRFGVLTFLYPHDGTFEPLTR